MYFRSLEASEEIKEIAWKKGWDPSHTEVPCLGAEIWGGRAWVLRLSEVASEIGFLVDPAVAFLLLFCSPYSASVGTEEDPWRHDFLLGRSPLMDKQN